MPVEQPFLQIPVAVKKFNHFLAVQSFVDGVHRIKHLFVQAFLLVSHIKVPLQGYALVDRSFRADFLHETQAFILRNEAGGGHSVQKKL